MPSHRPGRLATGTILSVVAAMALSCVVPLGADAAKRRVRKPSAKPAAAAEVPIFRAGRPSRLMQGESQQDDFTGQEVTALRPDQADRATRRQPREQHMRRGRGFNGDLRLLPQTPDPWPQQRPEREAPPANPVIAGEGPPQH
jgi:hypothetical protein